MKPTYQKQHAALIKQLLAALPKQTGSLEKRFAELFFARMLGLGIFRSSKLESLCKLCALRSSFFKSRQRPYILDVRWEHG